MTIYLVLLFIVLFVASYNFYPKISDYGSLAVIAFGGGIILVFNLIFNFTWLFVESKLKKRSVK